ncbi:Ger(x)C family spore germination protein [Gorillibacterium sp. sgz500922]|uniref:Ger(x)C family spore germination protein n=1 Tax=Gorillibacterium sp. sgz500922 TaxID=3446694 RepID=UPI003F681FAC
MISSGRRLLLCLLSATLAVGLAGCWNRDEVNTILIVLGGGIDALPDGRIEVTAQFFNSTGKSSGGGNPNNPSEATPGQTLVMSGSGDTLFEAIQNLQRKLPRTLFWGHNKTFIFGEAAAKRGIQNEMDFFLRFSETRERTRVLVCEGTAKKLLGLQPLIEISSSLGIMYLVEKQYGIDRNLKDLAEGVFGESHAIALPYIKVSEDNAKKSGLPTIRGCALLEDGVMKGYLDVEETRGMLWAENHSRWINLTVPLDGDLQDDSVDLHVFRSSASFKPKIEKDKWSLEISVDAQAYIVQNSSNLRMADPGAIQTIAKKGGQMIAQDLENTMSNLQKKYHVDALQMAQMFHRKYPKEWEKVKNRWDEKFPDIQIEAKAKCRIQRSGMYSK